MTLCLPWWTQPLLWAEAMAPHLEPPPGQPGRWLRASGGRSPPSCHVDPFIQPALWEGTVTYIDTKTPGSHPPHHGLCTPGPCTVMSTEMTSKAARSRWVGATAREPTQVHMVQGPAAEGPIAAVTSLPKLLRRQLRTLVMGTQMAGRRHAHSLSVQSHPRH